MKTGIHAKLKWLIRPGASPSPLPLSPAQEAPAGWLTPQTAETLLGTPLRQSLMKIIWQRTSLSGALFADLYQAPVARFAERVQLLPASEYHHHSHPGGLLDHTLEVMAFAAKLRQRHLLPPGAAPEDQAREAEAWTAGIIYASLLHDAGKIATDIEVMTDNNQIWHPWQGLLQKNYRLRYHKKRDHQLHPVAGSLLTTQILPAAALNWLAQYRELYESFLYCVSGHYDQAGIMGELVQEADRASVAQFMGANASAALARPQPSLPKQLLTALRELVPSQFKLNNPNSGSDGWLTEEALWLISKTSADRIRTWLLQQGVTSVPDSNIRLFDEMQTHGLLLPTPEGKAVWTCEITADSGWTPGCPLTLLCLPPARIWNTPGDRPAAFTGRITPVVAADTSVPATGGTDSNNTPPPVTISDTLADLTFSLFAQEAGSIACVPVHSEPADTMNKRPASALAELAESINPVPPSPSGSPVSVPDEPEKSVTLPASGAGRHFIDWLRQGILARKIPFNETKAPVHMVQGRVLLVSPGIFRLYVSMTTGDTGNNEWIKIQKAFQRQGLHQRGNDGVNIFICEVKGPRKTRQVKGYLLDKPENIFGNAVPEDNPYLSIVTQ